MTTAPRRQLELDVEQVLVDTIATQMRPGQVWNSSKPLDALLPLIDRVAAEAAAEALTGAIEHVEDLAYSQCPDSGTHGGGLLAAVGELHDLRARVAQLRAAPTVTETQED